MNNSSGAAPVRILHLDDSPFDAELVKITLEIEQKRFPTAVKYVQNREEFVNALGEEHFDVILSDYRMPGFDGDQALRLALEKCPDTPFIMVTGELGEERVIETLQRGATDYVLKDRIFRLVPAIRRAIAEAENERKRKEAEEALRKAHHRTSEILESIQDAFYSIDRHWQFTYINRKAEELWGVKAESIIGRDVYTVFPQATNTIGMRELELAMEEGQARRFEFFSPVVHMWVDVHAYPTADGGLSVVFRDITERFQTEQALRRQAALIDLTPDAIIVRTVEGNIISWNKGAEELYGWRQEEVLGKVTNEILHTQFPRPFEEIVKDLEAHGQWKGEIVHSHRSGTQITVESRWLLYDDPLAGRLLMESNVDMRERKRAETEREQLLQEVERRRSLLRSVVDWAPIGISILQGPEHRYVITNPAFVPIVAGKGDVAGRTVAEVFPEVAQQIIPLLDHVYRAGEPFRAADMPFTLVRNGRREETFFTFIYAPWYNEQGTVEGVMSLAVETTEQVRTRQTIEHERERLSLAQRTGHVGVFDWDLRTDKVTWTPELEEMFGFGPGTFPGTYEAWTACVHPEDLPGIRALFDRWIQSPGNEDRQWEYRITCPESRECWIAARARLFRDSNGRPIRVIGTNLDITERKRTEEALRAATEKAEIESAQLQAILNSMSDGVMVADATGTVIYLNPAALEIYGYKDTTGGQWRGADFGSFFRSYDLDGNMIPREEWAVPRALRGEEVRNYIHRMHRTDIDKWFTASYNATRVLDSAGNVRMVITTFRDVTAQIEAEGEVRRLNRELEARVQQRTQELEALNHELQSFSYTVSHDLRAPLQVISGYAELLIADKEDLSRQQCDRLRHIVTNTERMQALITALLDFARLAQKPLHETTVDMRDLVQAVVQEQRRSARIRKDDVRVEIRDLPLVQADPMLMRQVVTNLVSNAFKYTRKSENPHIVIGAVAENGAYQFYIRDNGIGFPHDKATKLFGVFQRLHSQSEFEGTGIGLANVRKIVERHGGKVWAEGETGKGAAFFFTIPRKEWLPKRIKRETGEV